MATMIIAGSNELALGTVGATCRLCTQQRRSVWQLFIPQQRSSA